MIFCFCYLQVSAKNGRGVEDLFLQLSRTMSDKQAKASSSSNSRKKGRDVVTVVDEPTDAPKSGGCC
jgi:GTPase SAR1 family protein